ncbi:hypothetical protein L7F22_011977 [Adiantum nelumboides]|nr:hypothetical protein [Adiantum nelumboides]
MQVANGRGIVREADHQRRVGLLDPDDFAFPVMHTTPAGNVIVVRSARQIMEVLGRWHPGILAEKASIMEQMTQEMESSALHQESTYIVHAAQYPRQPPHELATASAIDWEQSIVEGHPTHPMHKSRFAVPPTLPISPDRDLRFPTIHFFAVRRSLVTIRRPFDELLSPLLHGYCSTTEAIDWANETVVPVHDLQLPNVHANFPQARQLSLKHPARAQVSLRTVLVEALPGRNIKLAVAMEVGSCMRTISPWSTHIGPTFGPIAKRVIEDENDLQLCSELASVVGAHPDPHCAKHFELHHPSGSTIPSGASWRARGYVCRSKGKTARSPTVQIKRKSMWLTLFWARAALPVLQTLRQTLPASIYATSVQVWREL